MGRCGCSNAEAAGCQCAIESTNCIEASGSGVPADPFRLEPVIDPDEDNLLSCGLDGLLATARPPSVRIYGIGNPVTGRAAPDVDTTEFLLQMGSAAGSTDSNGNYRLFWPNPFPTGVVAYGITLGDLNPQAAIYPNQNTVDLDSVDIYVEDKDANTPVASTSVRFQYWALGW